jgi:ribosomal protein S19E (S16A)
MTSAEQEAFERVAHGDTSTVTADILGRLIVLGLVERSRTGPSISQTGLQFLAARGVAPRPRGRP